jgi:putative transposase
MANTAKVTDLDYITFLLSAQTAFGCTEASRTDGAQDCPPAHDAYTRLLQRLPPDTEALWHEVEAHVEKTTGLLVMDDTTLDKPHARHMALVGRHWSGKHKRVVLGINLMTLLWTDGGAKLPIDCRLDDQVTTGITRNQYFQAMLDTAQKRGFHPAYVCFDSWYAGLDNLKHLRETGWHWLTRLKSNRIVNHDKQGQRQLGELNIPQEGLVVYLRGYGLVRVFALVDENMEHAAFWATDDLEMTEALRKQTADSALAIEEYHRGLKSCCAVERCQARTERGQRNHILLALRAFLRLEWKRWETGKSWYALKRDWLREAIQKARNSWHQQYATTA